MLGTLLNHFFDEFAGEVIPFNVGIIHPSNWSKQILKTHMFYGASTQYTLELS